MMFQMFSQWIGLSGQYLQGVYAPGLLHSIEKYLLKWQNAKKNSLVHPIWDAFETES